MGSSIGVKQEKNYGLLTSKLWVAGSIPAGRTIFNKHLHAFTLSEIKSCSTYVQLSADITSTSGSIVFLSPPDPREESQKAPPVLAVDAKPPGEVFGPHPRRRETEKAVSSAC